jgi:biofilm PGA synthesis N-glycosyltransferase PgaC
MGCQLNRVSGMGCLDRLHTKILVGICAYNEEHNIGKLLQNLLTEQDLPLTYKILVVCSGCTDRTPLIVEEFCRKDSRLELALEEFRMGKARALNKIFRKAKVSADILVLVNADALPEKGTIESLVCKLKNEGAGAVFARPVPLNEARGVSYGISHVVWKLHHRISFYKTPKLSGELCAILVDCLKEIPEDTATDEPFIELFIRNQGYRILYSPSTMVHIRCPTSIMDLFKQRKRIWIGHLQIRKMTGFVVPTSSITNTLWSVSTLKASEIPFALIGAFLEGLAYLAARLTFSKGKVPYIWDPIKSTKTSI